MSDTRNYVLLTWNPRHWIDENWNLESWDSYAEGVNSGKRPIDRWSIGRRRYGIAAGDRAYMLLQGDSARGLIAQGTVVDPVLTTDAPVRGSGGPIQYLHVQWDSARRLSDRIEVATLEDAIPQYNWRTVLNSGRDVTSLGTGLDNLWAVQEEGTPPEPVPLGDRFRALIDALTVLRSEIEPGPFGSADPTSFGTSSPQNFAALLRARQAPEALALFALYCDHVALNPASRGWQLSCLPKWSGTPGEIRAGTLSVGRDEVFGVWLDRRSGEVRSWLVAAAVDNARLPALPPGLTTWRSDTGRTYVQGDDPDALATLLESPSTGALVSGTFQALLRRTRSTDRSWHNADLAQFLGLGSRPGSAPSSETSPGRSGGVVMGYADVMARRRLHQAAFRSLLFAHSDRVACAVCGISEPRVLDAAHLTPDSAGGLPTFDNGAILCATHHRAFDAGLLHHDVNRQFVWIEGVEPFHDPSRIGR